MIRSRPVTLILSSLRRGGNEIREKKKSERKTRARRRPTTMQRSYISGNGRCVRTHRVGRAAEWTEGKANCDRFVRDNATLRTAPTLHGNYAPCSMPAITNLVSLGVRGVPTRVTPSVVERGLAGGRSIALSDAPRADFKLYSDCRSRTRAPSLPSAITGHGVGPNALVSAGWIIR